MIGTPVRLTRMKRVSSSVERFLQNTRLKLRKAQFLDHSQKKHLAGFFKDTANVILASFLISGFLDGKLRSFHAVGGSIFFLVLLIFSVQLSRKAKAHEGS